MAAARAPGLRDGWVDCDLVELRRGMTAEEAAKAAGVARRSWQRWEKARRIPTEALEMFMQVTKGRIR